VASVAPTSPSPVTVAVVSWNTRDLLRRCVESFAREVDRGLVDLWVVDNASTDGSAELVRQEFPWARLLASEENIGFGRAVNLVAEKTSSEWFAPANADIAVRQGAIERLLETGRRDPGAGAVAPRLVLPDGSTQHSVFAFPTLAYTALLSASAFRFLPSIGDRYAVPGSWDKTRARRVPWAVAAFLLVRRHAWDEVGGFDERQWMYAEDLDLGWRLRRAGWATRYEPRALVDHDASSATVKLFGPELAPVWQRSTYGFLARRRGAAYARAIALLNLAGAVPRWARVALRSVRDPGQRAARSAHGRWVLVHLRALRGRSALERLR